MAHITAGDLSPITIYEEQDYADPSGSVAYYADVAEGGKFTMQDDATPYLAWRYGDRSFDPNDYVTRQKLAGFNAVLETRDAPGWGKILEYAMGVGGTAPYGPLPSRTEQIHVRTAASMWQGRSYYGCKTDSLTVSADAPGGIVKFDETVLASYSESNTLLAPIGAWISDVPAVQWMNGITINGDQIYPQSFSLTVDNALGRKLVYKDGGAVTGALLEGRRDIYFETEIWMEDLSYIDVSIDNGEPGNIVLTLGIEAPVVLTLTGVRWMADGTHPDLIQDKQRDKLRFRATAITLSAPDAFLET